MFEHYLPNKNEDATVAPKSKFRELIKDLANEKWRLADCHAGQSACTFAVLQYTHDWMSF